MATVDAPPPPADIWAARYHWGMLLLACFVIVAAFLLQVTPEDRVAIFGAPEAVLPHTCMTYRLLGMRCPGCGLTRSFIHLAHGDWWSSWRSHRVGWLLD